MTDKTKNKNEDEILIKTKVSVLHKVFQYVIRILIWCLWDKILNQIFPHTKQLNLTGFSRGKYNVVKMAQTDPLQQ